MRASRTTDARLLVCLALASILVNILFLTWFGIHTGNDTFRYLTGAEDLLNGRPFRIPFMSQYLGYVGVVALSSVAGTGLTGIVALQLVAAALAALALFDLGRQLCGRLRGRWRRPRSSSTSTSPGGMPTSSATLSTSRSS